MKLTHPDLQEEKGKSIVWSSVSQKGRRKNVTVTLNEEFCNGGEIRVEICPNKFLEMKGACPIVKILKGTKQLNLSALEAGTELAIEDRSM